MAFVVFTAGITDVKDDKPKDSKEKGLITASHRSPITTLTPIVSYTDRSEFNNLFILYAAWWTSFEIIISKIDHHKILHVDIMYHLKKKVKSVYKLYFPPDKEECSGVFSNMFDGIIILSID